MRLRYVTLRQRIAERLRQPELLEESLVEGTFDLPAFQERFIDRLLLKNVRQLLREIPQEETDALGAYATAVLTLADGDPLPMNCFRILSASIDNGPDEPLSEVNWYLRGASVNTGTWSVVGGTVRINGTSLTLHVAIVPTLDDLKNDRVALPQGYDSELIERVVRWIEFANDQDEGRV